MYRTLKALPILLIALCVFLQDAVAQTPAIPSVINPRLRLDPVPIRPGVVRFLTSDDSPPLNFVAPDGTLAGYNIDLARALCQDLKMACTIQARRAGQLGEALLTGAGDAVIPAPPDLPDAKIALSLPYLPRPARFAIRTAAPPLTTASGASLAGRTVGVIADSPYAAYLARFFPQSQAKPFATLNALLAALQDGSIDLAFADGADLAFWLNGVTSANCCAFVPGAFIDPKTFSAGLAIATRAADADLRRALDGALTRLDARGTLAELYLRYFPVPLF